MLLGFVSYEQYFILHVEEKGHAKRMEFWERQMILAVPSKCVPCSTRVPLPSVGVRPLDEVWWDLHRRCSGSAELAHGHVLVEGETGSTSCAFLLSLKPLLSWHQLCWDALKPLAGMCCRCMECVMDVRNVGDIILHYYCRLKLYLKDVGCWLG